MINEQLLNPGSIVVIGGSNNVHKPGGAIVRNIINGGFSRNEAWGGACNQLDVYTTILDLLKIEAPWRGLGHTLLTTDYQNSVSDDSRKWDYSEWMISSNYFNQP